MSLSEFSTLIKARAALADNSTTAAIIGRWEDALGTEASKASEHHAAILKDLVNLRLQDQSSGGRPTSQFRNAAQTLSHNVAVVDEELLVRHWVFYGLKVPTVNGKRVEPGAKLKSKQIPTGLMYAYITWYNNEFKFRGKEDLEYYTNQDKVDAPSTDVTGVRFKSTYANTSANMRRFMVEVGGLNAKDAEEYGKKFEVGHIESQAFIRLKLTNQAGIKPGQPTYYGSFIDKIVKFHELLDLASSSLKPEYAALTAAVFKDTRNIHKLYVNVQMQLKDNADKRSKRLKILDANTNQGSGDLSAALGFVAILKDIGSTAQYESEYGAEKYILRDIGADAETIAVNLKLLYDNYKNNYVKASKALLQSLPNRKAEITAFMLDLKSSDSIRKFAKNSLANEVINTLKGVKTGKPLKPINTSINNVPIKEFSKDIAKAASLTNTIKTLSNKVKQNLNKLKSIKKQPTSKSSNGPAAQLRDLGGRFSSLVSLQNILNQRLSGQITENMGDGTRYDILNYRTGRFANTVFVDKMSQSREGMITAFYTYMKYPYQTFEPGHPQGSPASRDPKLLISKSIREIGATIVKERMRAVLI